MLLNILGTDYEIIHREYADDPYFEKSNCDGYCDKILKQIIICNFKSHPCYADESEAVHARAEKSLLRHEIVHAFLFESGLDGNSTPPVDSGWAVNEEMVDWIALQAPKLMAAFQTAGAI